MKKQTWTTYALLGAILAGLLYFAYFKPRLAELKSVRAERIMVEDQVTQLKAKKRQLDRIEAELTKLTASLAELEMIIPQKRETADILRNIQQMAFDQQLDLIRFAQDREAIKEFYTEWPIPIQVNGTFHNLAQFFDRILHFPRIFNIEDFAIKALPDQSAGLTISASFTLKSYFFQEQALLKKTAPTKPNAPVKDRNEF
jgi:type IV pilus assembly protein PilO